MGSKIRKILGLNPEFYYLENKEILKLDILIGDIIRFEGKRAEKEKMIKLLKKKWDCLLKQYIRECKNGRSSRLEQFSNFIQYWLRWLSISGMNLGRSLIGIFFERKLHKSFKKIEKILGTAIK